MNRWLRALAGLLLAGVFTTVLAAVSPEDQGQAPTEDLYQALREAVAQPPASGEANGVASDWLETMSRRLESRVPDGEIRRRLLGKLHEEALRADLEPELVLAVIEVESNFDRFAISSAGARGLMQVMPFWLETIGQPGDNLFRVATNLRFGCTILRHYLDVEDGNLTRALARYNGSLGQTWYPDRVYDALQQRWTP